MLPYVKNDLFSCSGCGLCSTVCRQNAITMEKGDLGFRYPKINEQLCTSCGACEKICPFESGYVTEIGEQTKKAYLFKHSDAVRKESASGGFFTALSDYILEKGGVIYGAALEDGWRVSHIRADGTAGRDAMRGSKYVQSNMLSAYNTLRADVKSGKPVLFTGTPCQCAAVRKACGSRMPENLYIMDLICHGVMSETFFEEYLDGVRKKSQAAIEKVNFRDKEYGWQEMGILFSDGTKYRGERDFFYLTYLNNAAVQRPSCFSCPFATEKRLGDFTVGDFWGMKETHPSYYDALGVSLVLANTARGLSIMEELAGDAVCVEIPAESYFKYQPNLSHPTLRSARADKFESYYRKHGYEKTVKRFFVPTLRRRINSTLMRMLKKLHLR